MGVAYCTPATTSCNPQRSHDATPCAGLCLRRILTGLHIVSYTCCSQLLLQYSNCACCSVVLTNAARVKAILFCGAIVVAEDTKEHFCGHTNQCWLWHTVCLTVLLHLLCACAGTPPRLLTSLIVNPSDDKHPPVQVPPGTGRNNPDCSRLRSSITAR